MLSYESLARRLVVLPESPVTISFEAENSPNYSRI